MAAFIIQKKMSVNGTIGMMTAIQPLAYCPLEPINCQEISED